MAEDAVFDLHDSANVRQQLDERFNDVVGLSVLFSTRRLED